MDHISLAPRTSLTYGTGLGPRRVSAPRLRVGTQIFVGYFRSVTAVTVLAMVAGSAVGPDSAPAPPGSGALHQTAAEAAYHLDGCQIRSVAVLRERSGFCGRVVG